MVRQIMNQKDVQTIARRLIDECKKAQTTWATVVALKGDLGAGKTTLTKKVAHILGVKGSITSPTFVIEKVYGLPKKGIAERYTRFIHIDAYRLKNSTELDALGWHRIVNDPHNLIFIEWPENVKKALPNNTLWVEIKHINETSREINW